MQSGRIGVVVGQHEKSLLAPMVRVFFSTKSNLRIAPEMIDLSASGLHDKILSTEDSSKWDFPDLDDLWQGADT